MFKVCLILALTVASLVAAQESPAQPEAAPEPYSYGYQTDTHAAQEQRDPSGRVTGSYQLVGDDGRERRVEYVADENGYRAKVTTNEVGTKSENSADVEVVASEPTAAQFAPQPPQVQYVRQQQQQLIAPQVAYTTVQQPAGYRQVSSSSSSSLVKSVPVQQAGQQLTGTYGYGYYPGYGYGNTLNSGYYGYNTAGYGNAGYGNGYGYRYATSAAPQVYSTTRTLTTGAPAGAAYYGNYNYHTPGQYYASIGQPIAAGQYASGQGYRYVSQPAGVTSSSVRTVGVQAPVSYTVQPAGVATSNLSGSSNYIVLQKRAAATTATVEENKAKSS